MKKNVFLILSCILLLATGGIFFYMKKQNDTLNAELHDLQDNVTKVTEKIDSSKETKKEKENEYEKLKEEVKEKVEELDIWKELEQKLNTALSS